MATLPTRGAVVQNMPAMAQHTPGTLLCPSSFILSPSMITTDDTGVDPSFADSEGSSVGLLSALEEFMGEMDDDWQTTATSQQREAAMALRAHIAKKDADVGRLDYDSRGETLYLYLIDEVTCEPVTGDGVPIVLDAPKRGFRGDGELDDLCNLAPLFRYFSGVFVMLLQAPPYPPVLSGLGCEY